MRKRNGKIRRLKQSQRIAIAILGLVIFAWGALTLIGGQMNYASSSGGSVFAPFAFLIGMSAILMAMRPGNRS
jgi:hypothetical protein